MGTNSLNGVTANGMVVIDRLDPPTVASGSVFEPPYGCDYNKLMIYVPAKALSTYKSTQGFNNPLYVLIYPMESIGLKSEAVGAGNIVDEEINLDTAPLYNAAGVLLAPEADRRYVESLTPGLYIWNGKKIIIR